MVYLTAYADDETLKRARVTEPFGYLLKPFEDSQLRTVIEMALYKHTAERKLRESERRYAVTLASIGDAVIATDDQGRVTFLNPVAEALTGWPQAEATGRPLAEVFHIVNEETRQPVEDPAAKVLRLGTVVGLANHTVLLARDGREVPIDDCGAPIIDDRGSITGVVLVFRDTTLRRQAEEAAVCARPTRVWSWRFAARTWAFSELEHAGRRPRERPRRVFSLRDQSGYDRFELATEFAGTMPLVHPDDRERVEGACSPPVRPDQGVRGRVSDPAEGWLVRLEARRGVAVRNAEGRAIRFHDVSIVDITDLKRAEEVLRESEQRFRTLTEALPHMVWTAEPDGAARLLQARNTEYTGLTPEAAPGPGLATRPSTPTICRGASSCGPARSRPASSTRRVPAAPPTGASAGTSPGRGPRDDSGRITKWFGACIDIDDRSGRGGTAAGQGGGGGGQPGQGRVPGQRQPRDPHPHERHPRHDRAGPRHAADRRPAAMPENGQVGRRQPAGHHQRPARLLQDRGRQAGAGTGRLLPAGGAGRHPADPGHAGPQEGAGTGQPRAAGRARRPGRRRRPAAPGAAQPGRQRHQVHRAGRGGRARGGRRRARAEGEVGAALRGERHGHRHPARQAGEDLPGLRAGGHLDDAQVRRHRPGPVDRRPAGGPDGRHDHGAERARPGQHLRLHGEVRRQPHPAETTRALPPVLLRDLRVLVVDDNATNRHILEEWLRDWQMDPTAVGDGVAAMDVLWDAASAGRPYPLVLLDARMPDTDGLALAARIRERAALSAIRIILLTSGDRPGDPARSRELRIDAHLLKPVQQDELLETIYRVMSRARGDAPPAAGRAGREPDREPAPATAPLHILVAEDNEFSAQLLERLLARRGHRVRLATNGREALALAEERRPSTCCCWTSTCRSWTASRSSGRSGSGSGPRGDTCPSSP